MSSWSTGRRPTTSSTTTWSPCSINLGEVDQAALLAGAPQRVPRNAGGRFQLFRIGDAVASRNVHAAVYDALRLCLPI